MLYKKGDRIINVKMPDWGVGQVINDSTGDFVDIFFEKAGERKISLKHTNLQKLEGKKAESRLLDNLIRAKRKTKGFKTIDEAIIDFFNLIPKGFYEEEYVKDERTYKVEAHQLIVELLSKEQYSELLDTESFEEICKRALNVVNKTNLIFPYEKMSLKDGLIPDNNKKIFSESLNELLHGDEGYEERFNKFIHTLNEINASKWTTATYFPFIMYPEEHIFIKPTNTQHAADICAFEINYRPELNYLTYKSVLEFANFLKDSIKNEKPRDMIDIQSFMWCIEPGKY